MNKTIKRYKNRKLYDSGSSKFISLKDLTNMIKDGMMVTITDNETGEDITIKILINCLNETNVNKEELIELIKKAWRS